MRIQAWMKGSSATLAALLMCNGMVLAAEPVSDVREVTRAFETDLAAADITADEIIRRNSGGR